MDQNDESTQPVPGHEPAPEAAVADKPSEDMEVHYHPHSAHGHKKKFREYLSDFLMIFLAVTLGFIAENLREHIVEASKEKEYVHGFIANLKQDTLDIKDRMRLNALTVAGLDTVSTMSGADFSKQENRLQLYRLVAKYFNEFGDFDVHDVTMQQVKFSGDLRIVNNGNAADSLVAYYAGVSACTRQGEINTQLFMAMYYHMEQLFDFSAMYDPAIMQAGYNKPLPAFDEPVKLRTFFNKVTIYRLVLKGHNEQLTSFALRPAERLIGFLKKEYHVTD